jgi:hypothetical protein
MLRPAPASPDRQQAGDGDSVAGYQDFSFSLDHLIQPSEFRANFANR